jgi:sugar transferase (PEP-CTERM/EpsH1 system associated)
MNARESTATVTGRSPGLAAPVDAIGPGLAQTSQALADLLFVAHRVPYPPDKGDRIRSYHLLRTLAQRSRVHLACLADEPVAADTIDALGRICHRVRVVPLGARSRWARASLAIASGRTATEGAFDSPRLRLILGEWAADTRFHAAVASSSGVAPYLRLSGLRDVWAVVDLVDVDSQKWLDYAGKARGPRAWLYRIEGRRLRRLERGLLDWARAVTLVSHDEAALYRAIREHPGVHAVTNGVDLEYFRPMPVAERARCVFVGALDYRPNVDGALWFRREVWPTIRRSHPEATLTFVGRRPAEAIRRLDGRDGVELVGQVPDVRPHVAEAAVVIAPLRIARGVQNKVLEALAMGKAVVASPQALTGLRLEPGVHALVASTPEVWAETVARLLADASLRRRLGDSGRAHVESYHRWESCLEPFGAILGCPAGMTRSEPGVTPRSLFD